MLVVGWLMVAGGCVCVCVVVVAAVAAAAVVVVAVAGVPIGVSSGSVVSLRAVSKRGSSL